MIDFIFIKIKLALYLRYFYRITRFLTKVNKSIIIFCATIFQITYYTTIIFFCIDDSYYISFSINFLIC